MLVWCQLVWLHYKCSSIICITWYFMFSMIDIETFNHVCDTIGLMQTASAMKDDTVYSDVSLLMWTLGWGVISDSMVTFLSNLHLSTIDYMVYNCRYCNVCLRLMFYLHSHFYLISVLDVSVLNWGLFALNLNFFGLWTVQLTVLFYWRRDQFSQSSPTSNNWFHADNLHFNYEPGLLLLQTPSKKYTFGLYACEG